MAEPPASGDRVKRRLVAVLIFAVALPGLLLSYGSLQAVRADRFVLAKLREERLAGAASEAVARIEENTRERARRALGEIDPDLLGERLAALPEDPLRAAARLSPIETFVERAREREPLIRETFAVDATSGRLLLPRGAGLEPAGPGARQVPEAGGLASLLEGEAGPEPAERSAAARRLAEARALEIERHDPAAALAILRDLAKDPADPELAARARLDLARCEARLGDADGALSDLEVLARVGPGLRTHEGISIAPAARLLAAELAIAAGRRAEGAARLLDLMEDVLEGRLFVEPGEARLFFERARARLEGPDSGGLSGASAVRLARLVRLAARREEQRTWTEGFAARVLSDLLTAVRASPPSGEVSHLATVGGTPRLFSYRTIEPAAGRRLVIGVELDLSRLVRETALPELERVAADRSIALEICDRRGATLAGAGGAAGAHHEPRATAEFEDLLPFWKVRAAPAGPDPEAPFGRWRLLLQLGMVAVLAIAIGVGSVWTIRSVDRSLELARLKSEFVSNVSHELRTPLTSIRMFAEILRTGRARTPEKEREYLDTIMRESERLQRLIDDILDFARVEEGKKQYRFEAGDPGEAAEEALAGVGAQLLEAGFKIDLDVRRPLPEVRMDFQAMKTAIENLLTNARKYSGERREVALRVAREKESVRIEVEDKGVGIEEAELPRVFEKFFRGGEALALGVPGSGLGLALTKRIVEDHGGRIEVRSKKGEGTIFTIFLPAGDPARFASAEEPARA
jgi:signal transduction histidine kinase